MRAALGRDALAAVVWHGSGGLEARGDATGHDDTRRPNDHVHLVRPKFRPKFHLKP
jgi:hypothetical protein